MIIDGKTLRLSKDSVAYKFTDRNLDFAKIEQKVNKILFWENTEYRIIYGDSSGVYYREFIIVGDTITYFDEHQIEKIY